MKIEFFGCLAYRITTPAGLTIMVDSWRNLPVTAMGIGQWFNHDFPPANAGRSAQTGNDPARQTGAAARGVVLAVRMDHD